jgi:RNA polymerase sigma-70 factor (TIGR02960 family)
MSRRAPRRLTGMLTEADLAALSERHRRELHIHCYRMLASFEEAEDAVQETLLRAWRARDTFAGGGNARAWLYRIATNACLDALKRRGRRPQTVESFGEVPWIQPYADSLLDETVTRETIELAFLAVIQLLPPRQRAVVIARDVMGWSAAETSELLDTSVPAVNSALQRAHATLRRDWDRRGESAPEKSERELLRAWIDAHEREDVAAMIALMREDIRVTMPPHPALYLGIEALAPLFDRAFGSRRLGEWRLLPMRTNRQPAAAGYLRRPGDTAFRAFKLDVMRVEGDRFAEMTTFDSRLFDAFGLPAVL